MEETLTESQAIDFAMAYNLLLSIDIASDYIDGIIPIMVSRNASYALNKTKEAGNQMNRLAKVLKHEFFKKLDTDQQAIYMKVIENQKELMYLLFSLNPDKQNRVKGLIKKLINE